MLILNQTIFFIQHLDIRLDKANSHVKQSYPELNMISGRGLDLENTFYQSRYPVHS